jgi:hypothetical protein
MRASVFVLAVLVSVAAWSAVAQPAPDEAFQDFQNELSQQCPDKELQMLSARDLRDGLEDYQQGLDERVSDKLQNAEVAQCSSSDSGAACVNQADIDTVAQAGLMSDLAGSICLTFLRCTDQGVCEPAR